ncbi:MAG: nitroreductase family protein [Tissierellia bacterium]|nr:nitroreductase family protein [Tissierellia bacterium]
MIITSFLQKRRTVRDFKDQDLKKEDLAQVLKAIEDLNKEEEGLDFILFENGQLIYEGLKGKAGYNGVMIQAPHYIALKNAKEGNDFQLTTGYYLEKINTQLVNMDLGTCWITLDSVDDQTKGQLFGDKGQDIDYIIGLGYAKKQVLFDAQSVTPRHPVDEIVYKDEFGQAVDLVDLENLGLDDVFGSIRFAPSHKNSQPWRFLLEDGKVTIYMVDNAEKEKNLVDMGVIMYYFEELAKTKGVHNTWEPVEGPLAEGFIPLAEFKL